MKSNDMWMKWMEYGAKLGCHQRADRSFYFRGNQFPVCARCTGIAIGSIMAGILFFFQKPKIPICLFFMLLMFLDWLIQYLKIRESGNIRRLLTGILCGYGVFSCELLLCAAIVHFLIR